MTIEGLLFIAAQPFFQQVDANYLKKFLTPDLLQKVISSTTDIAFLMSHSPYDFYSTILNALPADHLKILFRDYEAYFNLQYIKTDVGETKLIHYPQAIVDYLKTLPGFDVSLFEMAKLSLANSDMVKKGKEELTNQAEEQPFDTTFSPEFLTDIQAEFDAMFQTEILFDADLNLFEPEADKNLKRTHDQLTPVDLEYEQKESKVMRKEN